MQSEAGQSDVEPAKGRLLFRALTGFVTALVLVALTVVVTWRTYGRVNVVVPGFTSEQWDVNRLRDVIVAYEVEHGRLPESLEEALESSPNVVAGLRPGLVDVWGTPYHYEPSASGFDVRSYGADRRLGGSRRGADVVPSRPGVQPPHVSLLDFIAHPVNPAGFWILLSWVGIAGFLSGWMGWRSRPRDELWAIRLAAGVVVVVMAFGVSIVLMALHVIPTGH